jgi:acetyltransferase-like isoleucine patch superfamily enzyme
MLRITNKIFSFAISGAFAGFGKHTVLTRPLRLVGEERIRIGDHVFLGGGCWLQALPDDVNCSVVLSIGSGTSIAGACVISAVHEVRIEEDVLIARNVYIADHRHRFDVTELPILAQGLDQVAPVHIKRGAWLAQNVVVCPGVTIGRGAVIGANSVVKQDIPDFAVAVGSPARVVKRIGLAAV